MNLDRILAAVGRNTRDQQELLSDLEGIRSLHSTGVERRRRPAEQERTQARIIATAQHLKSLLPNDIRYRRHLTALDNLIDEAGRKFPPELSLLLDMDKGLSAFENLVRMLCITFDRYFGRAGYTQVPDTATVTGEFIDFAEAVLKELNITYLGSPYSRLTIGKALTKVYGRHK